jgi:hypothetical protein
VHVAAKYKIFDRISDRAQEGDGVVSGMKSEGHKALPASRRSEDETLSNSSKGEAR